MKNPLPTKTAKRLNFRYKFRFLNESTNGVVDFLGVHFNQFPREGLRGFRPNFRSLEVHSLYRRFSLKENMVKLHYFKNQRYSKLKGQCERDERLFVDPEFPPETKSLYFSRATPPEHVEWKRPKVL